MTDIKKTTVEPRKPKTDGTAAEGDVVRVHYKGRLGSGEEFDSSEGKEPIEFAIGEHSVIPGFENAIVGMKRGEKKTVRIAPKEAYGEPNDELKQTVPREALGEVTPKEGMQLAVQHPAFPQPIPVRVAAVTDDTVTLDLNHPLAGETLHFDIELVDIR